MRELWFKETGHITFDYFLLFCLFKQVKNVRCKNIVLGELDINTT